MFVWKQKCPLENVIARTYSWIQQPRVKTNRWIGQSDGRVLYVWVEWFTSRTIGLLDVRMLEQSHPMV